MIMIIIIINIIIIIIILIIIIIIIIMIINNNNNKVNLSVNRSRTETLIGDTTNQVKAIPIKSNVGF